MLTSLLPGESLWPWEPLLWWAGVTSWRSCSPFRYSALWLQAYPLDRKQYVLVERCALQRDCSPIPSIQLVFRSPQRCA